MGKIEIKKASVIIKSEKQKNSLFSLYISRWSTQYELELAVCRQGPRRGRRKQRS